MTEQMSLEWSTPEETKRAQIPLAARRPPRRKPKPKPVAPTPEPVAEVALQLHLTAKQAGVTRRVAPHQFRHSHAVDLWREGIDVFVVQRQLGHARLDVTAHYLSGVAPVELLEPIGRRRPPLMPVGHSTSAQARTT